MKVFCQDLRKKTYDYSSKLKLSRRGLWEDGSCDGNKFFNSLWIKTDKATRE